MGDIGGRVIMGVQDKQQPMREAQRLAMGGEHDRYLFGQHLGGIPNRTPDQTGRHIRQIRFRAAQRLTTRQQRRGHLPLVARQAQLHEAAQHGGGTGQHLIEGRQQLPRHIGQPTVPAAIETGAVGVDHHHGAAAP